MRNGGLFGGIVVGGDGTRGDGLVGVMVRTPNEIQNFGTKIGEGFRKEVKGKCGSVEIGDKIRFRVRVVKEESLE